MLYEKTNQELQQEIQDLKEKVDKLYSQTKFPLEFNNALISNGFAKLTNENRILDLGSTELADIPVQNAGTVNEAYTAAISVGQDNKSKSGFVNRIKGLQFSLQHYPNNTNKQSFAFFQRDPMASRLGETISVTSGGNTVTITDYGLVTNELAGAIINIYNSSGALVEAQTIASNTATVLTISGTWGATTSGGTFLILFPVYLGSADNPFQRAYVQESTSGGIRFGIGKTWTSGTDQNGLLYMDSAGDLYWRNKGGTSTKLN